MPLDLVGDEGDQNEGDNLRESMDGLIITPYNQ